MSEKEILIQATGIKKSYNTSKTNKLEVLRGIDLKVYKGEIVAIVGKSGTGKSTLLHILGTLDKPDEGKLLFRDKDIFEGTEREIASFRNTKIGFIFQFHHLLPEFTSLENVMIAMMINGKSDRDKALELMKEVGVESRANHKPSQISGGEAQRVAIARALVNSPELVLADEPTGNLDTANANAVIELIFQLRNKFNMAFVIVTHNEEFASKCDRVIKMSDGYITSY
ncbi:MAG: ABC transporter ATP-binding protein [Ignavibacteriaceae bacterium]|jgi:ABC-type antimicrobial peptide transport system, ATPase component|nr:MAG: ABC transporter ATP-binding protein [Chlorobiota bacterium]MBW7856204.1 ABC transporter ATP-binding protein [Ignavibacteria bacterium]MCC6885732.1 ABC transporter ATP-binding protein [Ignavibacteriales bacterium]MCE7953073.1 ABC transporter ATP-binding protein [Chlorobi bacterium CHB7]MDL1887089.1 ABC transporter ATP-binding protein [Ignavibacteria bacterium CHB1]MEB2329144.1 ABC transporter ATP-binding protein [Ignavibacteriaceae bacterium]OQY77982.1 MAG: lipoprotein ABC transporter 